MARNYAALPHDYLEEMQELNDAEFGRLTRSLLRYSMTGEPIALSGNERFYAKRVMSQEDRFQESYIETSDKRREAGKKGAAKRWDSKNSNAILPLANDSKNSKTETNTKTKTKTETNNLLPNGSRYNTGAAVADYLNRVNPSASPMSIDELKAYEQEMGADVCKRAFDISLDNKSAKWSYIKAILSKWQSLGVKCVADIELLDRKPETATQTRPVSHKNGPGAFGFDQNSRDSQMAKDLADLDKFMREHGGELD